MKKFLLSFLFVVSYFSFANAQITVSIPDTTLTQNSGSISIPINVTNFKGIGAISLILSYDPNILTFTGTSNNPSHGTFIPPNASNGQIIISWYDTSPLDIGNGVLFNLNFNFTQGNSDLNFINANCEIADTGANVLPVTFTSGKFNCSQNTLVPAKLAGKVWLDSNNDGLINNGEKRLQWVTVDLFNCSGTWLKWKMTDTAGNYSFDSLAPGSYYVRFSLIDGYKGYKFTTVNAGSDSSINSHVSQTTDSTGNTDCISLSSGENYSCLNAGVINNSTPPAGTGSIGDFVWKDLDPNDGIQKPGDFGISNVTVKLLDCGGSLLQTTTTDNTGHYIFKNLAAGDYKVQFILPQGYVFVVQHKGNDTTVDSDPDPTTGMTNCFSLASGENLLTIDAGMSQSQVILSPKLWITKDDGTDVAPDSGNTTTYKISFGNSGNASLTNAVVIDTLPIGMTYVSSTKGSETSTGSNVFEFNAGQLNAGDSVVVELTAMVAGSEGSYLNTAYLEGNDSQNNLLVASATDLDLSDTTSNSDESGAESRGDLAELLLKRHLKIEYGMTTPILKNTNAKTIASLYNLSSFIPQTGPFNSKPVAATPFDILGISNATSTYAVNYQLSTSTSVLRVGGIFSTVTAAPYIYDHLKAVCDRLGGYQVDEIKLLQINGYLFYGAKLEKPDQKLTDYSISFSVYETPSGYQVQNKWTYEDYQSPMGASSVYNFQVWANSYDGAVQLVQNIIAKFKTISAVSYMNSTQTIPVVFIQNAEYTHDGKIHLSVINNSQTTQQIALSSFYRISQGDNQVSISSNYSVQPGVNNLVVSTGIISDANVYLSQAQGFSDEVFVSGGAYTYLNGSNTTVSNFNTSGYAQQLTSNYPKGSLVLSGGVYAAGQLNDWVSVVRSLTPTNSALDLTSYSGVRFTANGTGTLEVMLNLSNTQNYNYYTYKINLSGDSKDYLINFNQFKLLDGSQGSVDPKLVEDVIFNLNSTDNPGLNNFNFEVKNIAFVGNNVTAVNDMSNSIPKEFALNQNYPNPFNPSTVIEFSVPKQEKLSLTVYNILGQKVAQLLNNEIASGHHSITFDASRLSSGVYFYQLLGDHVNITKKMILTK